ncbi:MAG: hypothetical protein EB127_01805 [Alphaproteobacteria bacterium]|nr:hypothetical protein [Alphaproteobacteria bacterium]
MLVQAVLVLLSIIFLPLQIIIVLVRTLKNKEDKKRFLEKFAISDIEKKSNVIWIHAASVGESNIALNLINMLATNHDRHFLITTGTVGSAANVIKRIGGKESIIHQYIPIDNFFTIQKFLTYWRPKICILIESEIWPVTIACASSYMDVMLVNGAMSYRSFNKWSKFGFLIKWIGGKFTSTLVQTQKDYEYFSKLGFKNVEVFGNIKYTQNRLPIDSEFVTQLKNSIDVQKSIFAVSTHQKDDEYLIPAFHSLYMKDNNIKLIIAPRHKERTQDLEILCKKYGLNYESRTKNIHASPNCNVFILDTIGEVNNIFALGIPTFVGGSFEDGGHNILEPALYGCLVMFGPDMSNFQEISEEFIAKKAVIYIPDSISLPEKLQYTLDMSQKERDAILNRASKIIQEKQVVGTLYTSKIEALLRQAGASPRILR